MHRWLVLTLGLGLTPSLQAGIYLPGEPLLSVADEKTPHPLPHPAFRLAWADVLEAAARPDSPKAQQYRRTVEELRSRRLDRLSGDELAQLTGCLLRLRRFDEADAVLRSVRHRAAEDFRLTAHHALAAWGTGDGVAALQNQSLARGLFPGSLSLTAAQRTWLHRAETAQRDLFRGRLREGPMPPDRVDDLLSWQPTGPNGVYTAGPWPTNDQPPSESLPLVQQLLYWLPDDTRLYWLLGELYNAVGDVESAVTVFDECLDARRFASDVLKDHRRILRAEWRQRAEQRQHDQAWSGLPGRWQLIGIGGSALVLAGFLVLLQIRQFRRGRRRSRE